MHFKIHPQDPELARETMIDDNQPTTTLTIWKKSLVFSCNGFTVFNLNGDLAFRVDNYPSDPKNKFLLMDTARMALLTMRRKRPSLQNEWQGFLGEFWYPQTPSFVVKRSPFLQKGLAKVYMCSSLQSCKNKKQPQSDYRVEGCYSKRSFTFLNSFNEVIVEGNSKQIRLDTRLGGDVFNLTVRTGYDKYFVMGLIFVLDQIMPSK